MNPIIRRLANLYAMLLRLYPPSFYADFADEMQTTFIDALDDSAQHGKFALIRICLIELYSLPGVLVRAHWQARSVAIMETARVSWFEMLCAAIPFMLYLTFPIIQPLQFDLGAVVILFFLVAFFVSMFVGIFKGLPLWSLPALGLSLAILNYFVFGSLGMGLLFIVFNNLFGLASVLFPFVNETMPQIFRMIFDSGISYLAIVLLALVVALMSAFIKPFHSFYQRIHKDWTLFPFALYGIMPLTILISFDEYNGNVPYEVGIGLVLLAGLWLYLRFTQPGPKLLVLGISITLAMAIQAIGKWILIPSQSWLEIIYPITVDQITQSEVINTIEIWFWVMVAVFLPALFGLLPNRKQSLAKQI